MDTTINDSAPLYSMTTWQVAEFKMERISKSESPRFGRHAEQTTPAIVFKKY